MYNSACIFSVFLELLVLCPIYYILYVGSAVFNRIKYQIHLHTSRVLLCVYIILHSITSVTQLNMLREKKTRNIT